MIMCNRYVKHYANFSAFVLFLLCAVSLSGQNANPDSLSGLEQPLSFAAASDMALAFSADLRHAYASQGLKERAWLLGLRTYLPRFGLSVSENDRIQGIGPDSFLKNYGINADQLLWDGGRTAMSRKLERMELSLSLSRLRRAASEITEAALAAYRNVLSSRAALAIREQALESLAEQRRILSGEVSLGLALALDLSEADLALVETGIEIEALRSDLAEMEKQFAELLGLEALPGLGEKVDINRRAILPEADAAASLAEEKNPELEELRFSVIKKEGELKYTSRSWLPALRLTGSFALSGQSYPLTRHNWSVGLNIEFSSPFFQNSFGIQSGWEPPYDRTAQVQNTFTPLPDPAAGLSKNQAVLALTLERERYRAALERTGRSARRGVEKCSLADRKRSLAVEAVALAAGRYRVEEVRHSLGQITRLKLMEAFVEYTQKEIAAVEAAVALLEAERDLERILDLRPGELKYFASPGSISDDTLSARN